jgi:hypothetical protein
MARVDLQPCSGSLVVRNLLHNSRWPVAALSAGELREQTAHRPQAVAQQLLLVGRRSSFVLARVQQSRQRQLLQARVSTMQMMQKTRRSCYLLHSVQLGGIG